MIRDFIKIAVRNLIRHRLYSAISIFGMAVGLACTILIGQYVYHEWSYDRFHEDADRIFRVVRRTDRVIKGKQIYRKGVSGPLAEQMRTFPEVEQAVRIWLNERDQDTMVSLRAEGVRGRILPRRS